MEILGICHMNPIPCLLHTWRLSIWFFSNQRWDILCTFPERKVCKRDRIFHTCRQAGCSTLLAPSMPRVSFNLFKQYPNEMHTKTELYTGNTS
jgi:hypothetical protein